MKRSLVVVIVLHLSVTAGAQTWEELTDNFVDSFQAGKFKTAELLANKALEKATAEFGTKHENYATSLFYLARAYRELGKFKEAEPLLKKALDIRSAFGEKDEEYLSMLNSLGLLLKGLGKYYEAEPVVTKVLALVRSASGEYHSRTGTAMDNLASLLMAMGDYEKARPLFDTALSIKKKAGGKTYSYAMSLNNMGMLYHEISRSDLAEFLFKQALSIFREKNGGINADCATALNNLGLVYTDIGDFGRAGRMFIESLKIKKSIFDKDHPSNATTLNNLALVFQKRGLDKVADSLYAEALRIKKMVYGEDHPEYATSLDNLASFYLANGDIKRAEPLCKKALEIRSSSLEKAHPDYATSLNHLAMIYQKMGKLQEAKTLYEEALLLRERSLGVYNPSYTTSLSNMAAIYVALKEFERAEAFFIKANRNLLMQVNTYFSGFSEKEKGMFLTTVDFQFEVFNSFAAYRSQSRPQLISEMYNLNLLTRSLILNSVRHLRNTILNSNNDTLIGHYRRWNSLKERIAKAYVLGKETISFQHINLTKLEAEANDLEKIISKGSRLFESNINSTKITWDQVQKKLAAGEAAVEIVRFRKYNSGWTDSVCYAAIIITHQTSEYPKLILLENGNDMDDKYFTSYKKAVGGRLFGRNFGPPGADTLIKKELNALYDNYWKKIKAALGPVSAIYFSPDGVYHLISLNVLRNPIDSTYVLDEADIRTVSSTADILLPVPVTPKAVHPTAVLIGNPAYGLSRKERTAELKKMNLPENIHGKNEQIAFSVINSRETNLSIAPLPGTKTEVDTLNKIFFQKNWNVQSYTERKALEEVVKATANPRVLHIATHGFFLGNPELDEDSPGKNTSHLSENPLLYTGLLFTGAEETFNLKQMNVSVNDSTADIEDGILTALEAENLDLENTELVVLSACETGLGDLLRNGEGAYSLLRSFQIAGARSVVFTMWRVDDDATQQLMTEFYVNWLSNGNKRFALRAAQLRLREKYKDPFFWGAFMIIGN